MRYVLKKSYRAQLASGKAVFGIEVAEGEPQTLETGRGMLVSTSHLLAQPRGALAKFQAQIIVFGANQIPAAAKDTPPQ